MHRKPSQFVPSQSLFPDTQQLIRDLGPSPPPLFTQKGQKWPRSPNFSSDSLTFKTTSSQNRQTRFVAPLSRSLAENSNFGVTLDVIDPLSTSPVLKVQRSQKFQAPLRSSQSLFSQQVSTQHSQNKENYSFQKPPSVVKKLSHADLDMIGNFLGQSNGMRKSQLSNQKFTSIATQSLSKVSPLSKQTEGVVIPETPHHSRQFQSKTDYLSNTTTTNLDTNLKFAPSLKTPSRFNLPEHQTPGGTVVDGTQLRSVEEISSKYQSIFDGISYFNIVQSKVFEDVLYTDKPLVVCAPTGSGKTMIFELAITRLLIKQDEINLAETNKKQTKPKVVYMAPIKALCTERHEDWTIKFSSAGLECQELTGDSDVDDFWQLQKADIILTTPEKWDSMTRRWRDNSSLVRRVQLFLIDEVHLLNDETRGATMEAVVSRMKTIQKSVTSSDNLRFVAVSATIPNTGDIAEWLGSSQNPAVKFDMDESYRPVTLRKVVLGYPWSSSGSEFKFDINLNYKLANVIHTYAENKPTLVFCSTRKGVEQAASTLSRDASFIMDATHKQELTKVANLVRNHRLRELLVVGVGYHHAGLDSHDRHLMEEIFTKGDLLVLFSTSTLAMGVNLPAHLVIVKSTSHYVRGMFQEYTQTEMLQMIGRAGRPQFDTSATAVIMTREQSRNMYRDIVNGCQNIESSLHRHLIEHLNAEIVLTTIGDVTVALDWIRSTFLYIRILKNPTHYGYPSSVTRDDVDRRLRELCMHNLDLLTSLDLVSLDNDLRLSANEPGRLMARYCIAFETMKRFSQLHGTETLDEMVTMLSECREFQEVTLRMNERSALNKLNKDKNRVTVRYPVNGKIKTTPMKVSCLLQATLGCISVQEFALQQDVTKIFRNAARVCRCLVELLLLKDHFVSIYNGAILSKCVKAKLWENSRYVSKQLPNIGPSLSTSLANAGVCSFERLESIDPREIEMIVNRNPPFGNHLREAVKRLPKYHVNMEQSKRYSANVCDVTIQVVMNNAVDLSEVSTAGRKHTCLLLIGDSDNRVVLKQRLVDSTLMSSNGNSWQRTVTVRRAQNGDELVVKLISLEWVGLDIESTFTPYYLGARKMTATSQGTLSDVNKRNAPTPDTKVPDKKRRACRHTCHNKRLCAHDCCKIGISSQVKSTDLDSATSKDQGDENWKPNVEHLQKYRFTPQQKTQQNSQTTNTQSTDLNSSRGWEMFDSFCRSHQNMDDGDDDEIDSAPLKETKFQQQQNYYDDQINIGGRMKYSAVSSGDRNNWKHLPPDQRLWTMKGDSQDLDEEVDIAEIPPRPSKYGEVTSSQTSISQKLSHKTNAASQLDTSGEAPPQLGRVFAWKTSTGQRSHVVTPAPAKSNTQDHNRGTTCFSTGNPRFRDSVGKSFVANQVGNTASEGTNRLVNTASVYSKGCGLGEAPSQECFTRNSGEDRTASVARPAYMRGNVMGNTAVKSKSGYTASHSTHQVASGSVERKAPAQSSDQSSASNEYNNSIESIDLTREYSGIHDSTNSQILPQKGSFESRSGADKVNSASVSHSIELNSSSKGFNPGQNFSRGDEFEKNSCESQWRITKMKSVGSSASALKNNFGNTASARAKEFGDTASELNKNCGNTAEVSGGLKNIPGSTGQMMWKNNNAMKASKYHFKQCNNGTGYNRYIQDPCSSGNSFGNTASSSMWNKYEEPSVPQNARKMFLTNEQTNTDATRLPAETRNSIGEGKLSSENAKRVTFEDEVEQTLPLSDERDVSIRCDFDLSDDADDSLLMEACIQAEENMEMSEEIVQISSGPIAKSQVAQYRSQADKDIDDTSTLEGAPNSFNITDLPRKSRPRFGEIPGSRDSEKQMRARKADELAEAQRMFDSIFGAMF